MRLLLPVIVLAASSCATLSDAARSDAPADALADALSKELDTASHRAVERASGQALTYVVRAREALVSYLRGKDKEDIRVVVGCALRAYAEMSEAPTNTLMQYSTQYAASVMQCLDL